MINVGTKKNYDRDVKTPPARLSRYVRLFKFFLLHRHRDHQSQRSCCRSKETTKTHKK